MEIKSIMLRIWENALEEKIGGCVVSRIDMLKNIMKGEIVPSA